MAVPPAGNGALTGGNPVPVNYEDRFERIVLIAAILCCTYLGELIGRTIGVRDTQDEAIAAGAGRWEYDPKTKVKTFVWIGPKETEK